MKRKFFYLLLTGILISTNVLSQIMLKSADTYYSSLSFQDAIKGYTKKIKKDKTDGEALFNLANAYRLNGKTVEAEMWFEQAVVYNPTPVCKLFYAQVLLSNAKYLKAKNWFLKFADEAPNSNDRKTSIEMAEFCQLLADDGLPDELYIIKEVTFNSDKQDFSPYLFKDSSIVFVSNRDDKSVKNRRDAWTGQKYMKIFVARVNVDSQYIEPEKFMEQINLKYHEGPLCFTNDFTTMYYTQNQLRKNKPIVDDNKNTLLAIYQSRLIDGRWSNNEKLSFNNEKYSVCHPALSRDDDFMIFASDMPGGLGGMDLYIVMRDDNGLWGVPENLGPKINTLGNEVFPFLDRYNNLYYSSNMLVGFGGLDIYKAYYEVDTWSDPENIGVPINGHKDDFGIYIDETYTTGYFSSNRKGEDNIYSFVENSEMLIKRKKNTTTQKIDSTISVCGTVYNKKYKNKIKDAKVEVVSKCTGDETEILTVANGGFDFPIEENCDYKINVSKKNFKDTTFTFSTFNPVYGACMEIIVPLVFIDDDPRISSSTIVFQGKVLELYNVYYDFDQYYIRKDAAGDLDTLYNILLKYPSMKGELSSHTDSRGSHRYNEILSENRAKAAMKYLIQKGIDPTRLTYKGYGETLLKNECADGVRCNEVQHQRNRRTEFKITYLNETIVSKEIPDWTK